MTASTDAGKSHDPSKAGLPAQSTRPSGPSWRLVLITLATLTMIYEQVPLPLWLEGLRPAMPYVLHGIGIVLIGDLTRATLGYGREQWRVLRARGGIELRWSRRDDGSIG